MTHAYVVRSRYDSEWHKLVPISGQPSLRLPFNKYAEPELTSSSSVGTGVKSKL